MVRYASLTHPTDLHQPVGAYAIRPYHEFPLDFGLFGNCAAHPDLDQILQDLKPAVGADQ